ncbi:MAG TPA: secondary thiamine-phosphate synthase enzyme YjbQ [Tenuifilaceae bacterium]|nr:secondary thiamine-phosphate synthase enzyme YjbQ [Tenuifilaceae bacterium]
MTTQVEFLLPPQQAGFHLMTNYIESKLPPLPNTGILHLFIKHTSAALSINENADYTVRLDMQEFFKRHVPAEPYFEHTMEGDDDMNAHIKSTIIGQSVTIPITNGKLNLGTWQGIYLCEFRKSGSSRKIVATIIS